MLEKLLDTNQKIKMFDYDKYKKGLQFFVNHIPSEFQLTIDHQAEMLDAMILKCNPFKNVSDDMFEKNMNQFFAIFQNIENGLFQQQLTRDKNKVNELYLKEVNSLLTQAIRVIEPVLSYEETPKLMNLNVLKDIINNVNSSYTNKNKYSISLTMDECIQVSKELLNRNKNNMLSMWFIENSVPKEFKDSVIEKVFQPQWDLDAIYERIEDNNRYLVLNFYINTNDYKALRFFIDRNTIMEGNYSYLLQLSEKEFMEHPTIKLLQKNINDFQEIIDLQKPIFFLDWGSLREKSSLTIFEEYNKATILTKISKEIKKL